ncbi:MAG: CRISPR-associated endonuclease Cas1, partial [Caldilineales bacterium]|nr:CRISPR-associated endonuclease Cas1 [Caldilineales bacterium]
MQPEDGFLPDPSRPQANSAWGRLLGLEGSGSAAYFGVFGKLLKQDLVFHKRNQGRDDQTEPVHQHRRYLVTDGFA